MIAWAGIQPDQIDLYWPHVRPMFGDVIERSPERFTEERVVTELRAGRYQLWITHDGGPKIAIALITEIVAYPGGKYCRLQMVGGSKLHESADTIYDIITAWAREKGCTSMTCFPRPGLAKMLVKRYGFQFVKNTTEGKLYFRDLVSDERVH